MKIKITCTKREFAAMLDRCLVNRTTRNREYCCACPLRLPAAPGLRRGRI